MPESVRSGLRFGWFESPDSQQLFCFLTFGMVQIPTELQVHPESRRHPEETSEAKSCAWCYTATTINQLINALVGDMYPVSEFSLRDPEGFQKFFWKHLAWMGGRTVCGDAYHYFTSSW